MSLIKWELVKIFKQKSLYFIGIFLFAWFAYVLFSNTSGTGLTRQVYKEWEGPLTAEKIDRAAKVNEEKSASFEQEEFFPDERFMAEMAVVENIAQSQHIEMRRDEKVQELNSRISAAEAKGNGALADRLELEKQMLNELEMNKIAYYRGPLESVDFVNVFGLMLTGALLLIGLAGIYSNEHSSGVENYILSAKNGRTATMRAKLAAAAIFATVVVLAWELFNLGARAIVYGTSGWDLPIQYSFKYFSSPYSFTFMEYHLIQLAIHLLAAIAFACLIVVVSTLAKSTVVSFFVSGFLFGLPILAESIMDLNVAWVENTLRYTLTNIMKVEGLFMQFKSVSAFGNVVMAPYIGVAAAVVILVLSMILARFLIEKKQIA
ncbi:hypothetical protein [Mesobacillus subterraneus]|uniref:Uncharacterized protein n=1 Tax=Mesobacillus subterraneus TaxID=285983 RepID=A0A427TR35_9BACI|nr:hypothetical protein [Mesobacillus subterraneus]RSD26828.1 hypothetical protein EJA10_13315 [Mesobacillus subterraneus]